MKRFRVVLKDIRWDSEVRGLPDCMGFTVEAGDWESAIGVALREAAVVCRFRVLGFTPRVEVLVEGYQ